MSDLAAIFSAQGVLAHTIPNYRARIEQLEMAQAIAKTIQHQQILVAEAGTGTGKTFAYLVPALLFGGKVIISTGTKTLQDQLYDRDIPTIRAALKVPVTVALLKGRANYVCHYRLEQTLESDQYKLTTREDIIHLGLIERFAQNHQTGDKSSLSKVPENASIWQHVTSTRDNCLGSD
ncbi:MAG TPA: ATP-dependent DNA helicase, partial [Nitrosomonas sp.]|nr:ATP-dependent DNA helicase [Nitrosomonas sp.]